MKKDADNQLIFFETVDKDTLSLNWLSDPSRILYVGIRNSGKLYLYDNEQGAWQKSVWSLGHIIDNPHFKKVKTFNNGFISIKDAKTYFMSKPHLLEVGDETSLGV